MLKNEKGVSLIKLIIIVVLSLIFLTIVTVILTGENGLINQWKSESNKNDTQYVVKTNEEQGNESIVKK